MKRDLERVRPRRGIEWIERKRLGIEEEKLQNSRDFKEITFAITLFGGLLAFLIKLGDYFNNNVVVISGDSLSIIYITVWLTLIVLILLFPFLILKWYLVSTINENNWLKNITQKLFGHIPLLIILWFISLSLSVVANYYNDTLSVVTNYYNAQYIIIFILVLTFVFRNVLFDKITILTNLFKNISPKNVLEDVAAHLEEIIHSYNTNPIRNIIFIFLLVSTFLLPTYLLAGSYSIDKFQPSDTNSDIITFTITETGIPISNNYIELYKLKAGEDLFHKINNVTINTTHEKPTDDKSMLGKNHYGIWYLNLNISNLTSGNYMLHAEVTNDITKKSIFGTIKKHDDIIFYIPTKN